jgi:hypothetical protein
MKAHLLVGIVAACGGLAPAPAPEPSYPLCDAEGAPACGNIGQVGRPRGGPAPGVRQVPPVEIAPARPDPQARHGVPLLSPGATTGQPPAVPLLDASSRPAPGNCVGKCMPRKELVITADRQAP